MARFLAAPSNGPRNMRLYALADVLAQALSDHQSPGKLRFKLVSHVNIPGCFASLIIRGWRL